MHNVILDPVENTSLAWKIDWNRENVLFRLSGIDMKFKWFAVGFSRRGKFPRTDFCIYQQANGKKLMTDARSSDDGRSILVDKQQDCIASKNDREGFSFTRKFDTCDENDFQFHEGTMYIYWMRGRESLDPGEKFPAPSVGNSSSGVVLLQLLRADAIRMPEK